MADLDLAGLTEEEILHIQSVLSRDRSLQNKTKTLIPTATIQSKFKDETSPSDLVLAEIERVHQKKKEDEVKNEIIQHKDSNSESGEESPQETLFSAFADMLSELTSPKKPVVNQSFAALTSAVVNMDTDNRPKGSFKYNPRETIKYRPTLLELAENNRRESAPAIIYPSVLAEEDEMPAYRMRSRGNAMFSSSTAMMSGNQTSPSSGRAISGLKRISVDSVTAKKILSPVKTSFGNMNVPKSPRNMAEKHANQKKSETNKHVASHIMNASKNSQSPPKVSGVFETTKTDKNYLEKTHSPDSGIDEKNGARKSSDENGSPLSTGHGSDAYREEELNYEPDTESVEDYDTMSFISDSSYAPSSLAYGSLSSRGVRSSRDSWDESDASSGMYYMPSPGPSTPAKELHLEKSNSHPTQKPHWLNTRERRQKFKDNPQTSIDSRGHDYIVSSPASSPSISHRSFASSTATSPVARRVAAKKSLRPKPDETIGTLEISIIYYSSDSFRGKLKRTKIPPRGTKSCDEKRCNILSRKEYVEVSNSKLPLSHEASSGAPAHMNGEMHLTIKGAKFVPEILGKNKSPNTYVKCYLLPDKFHNSKMKSAVIKKNINPQWDHKFILAGFSQSELRDRCLEVVVGSWHFKKQEVLGGVVLSMGSGGNEHPWIRSNKQEAYVWNTALLMSGNKIRISLPLRARMKPSYF